MYMEQFPRDETLLRDHCYPAVLPGIIVPLCLCACSSHPSDTMLHSFPATWLHSFPLPSRLCRSIRRRHVCTHACKGSRHHDPWGSLRLAPIRKFCVPIGFLRYSRITTTSSLSSQDGWTALMLASSCGHREIAQLLVDRGADVNTQDKVGNCAFPVKKNFYY